MKNDAGMKADDIKARRGELSRAQKDLEPLQRQLEELRKAARGQVPPPPREFVRWPCKTALQDGFANVHVVLCLCSTVHICTATGQSRFFHRVRHTGREMGRLPLGTRRRRGQRS